MYEPWTKNGERRIKPKCASYDYRARIDSYHELGQLISAAAEKFDGTQLNILNWLCMVPLASH